MLACPHCGDTKIVKNGKTYYGKQNYKCKNCNRQFVERAPARTYKAEELLKKLLLERNSLHSCGRILDKPYSWVCRTAGKIWQSVPKDLPVGDLSDPEVAISCIEADELHSFVYAKDNPQWVWLAIERRTGLIVGFHIGARDEQNARLFKASLVGRLGEKALFFTDQLPCYQAIFHPGQHLTGKRDTVKIERFNNTFRQRCSRLVRKSLSFSKDEYNHYQALFFFLVNYNISILQKKASL